MPWKWERGRQAHYHRLFGPNMVVTDRLSWDKLASLGAGANMFTGQVGVQGHQRSYDSVTPCSLDHRRSYPMKFDGRDVGPVMLSGVMWNLALECGQSTSTETLRGEKTENADRRESKKAIQARRRTGATKTHKKGLSQAKLQHWLPNTINE